MEVYFLRPSLEKSYGCMLVSSNIIRGFKFQQTDRVQPAAHVQIQHEDLLQVTNGGWDVWMNHALITWTASIGSCAEHGDVFCGSQFQVFTLRWIHFGPHASDFSVQDLSIGVYIYSDV